MPEKELNELIASYTPIILGPEAKEVERTTRANAAKIAFECANRISSSCYEEVGVHHPDYPDESLTNGRKHPATCENKVDYIPLWNRPNVNKEIASVVESINTQLREHGVEMQFDATAFCSGPGEDKFKSGATISVPMELSAADGLFLEAMAKGLVTSRQKYPGNTLRKAGFYGEVGEAMVEIQLIERGHGNAEHLCSELRQVAQMACRLVVEGDASFPETIQKQLPCIVPPDPTLKPHHPGYHS